MYYLPHMRKALLVSELEMFKWQKLSLQEIQVVTQILPAEDGFKRFRVLFLIKLDECSRRLKIN